MPKPPPPKGLVFNPRNHTYRLDNKPIPGVTGLLDKGLAKPFVARWNSKVVADYVVNNYPQVGEMIRRVGVEQASLFLRKLPTQKRDAAANRGTEVHKLASQAVVGEEIEIPPHIGGYLDGYIDWLDEHNVQPILVEKRVASRTHWYAGTFDLICEIDGEVWAVDLKTSPRVYGSTALQIAAYTNADFYIDEDDPTAEKPLPQVDRVGAVRVSPFGTTLTELIAREKAFRHFLKVADNAREADTLDAYIGREMFTEQEAKVS